MKGILPVLTVLLHRVDMNERDTPRVDRLTTPCRRQAHIKVYIYTHIQKEKSGIYLEDVSVFPASTFPFDLGERGKGDTLFLPAVTLARFNCQVFCFWTGSLPGVICKLA